MQIFEIFAYFFNAGEDLEFAGFLPKVKQFSGSKFSILSFETNGTRCQIWKEVSNMKSRALNSSFIKQQQILKCASPWSRAFLVIED